MIRVAVHMLIWLPVLVCAVAVASFVPALRSVMDAPLAIGVLAYAIATPVLGGIAVAHGETARHVGLIAIALWMLVLLAVLVWR